MIHRWYAYNLIALALDPRRWRRLLAWCVVHSLDPILYPGEG